MRTTTAAMLLTVAMALACRGGDDDRNVVRGRGLDRAEVSLAARAQIYDAAARAAFDFGPGLSLLAHPRQLPRIAGRAGGDSLPPALIVALRNRGTVQGRCDAPDDMGARTPICRAPIPGYVVRFSDIFTVSGDTVQIYLEAERYDTPASGVHQAMHFERAYQLTRNGGWKVVREARIRP